MAPESGDILGHGSLPGSKLVTTYSVCLRVKKNEKDWSKIQKKKLVFGICS